jgi:hypothetical protein
LASDKGLRTRLFRALHAEAKKRNLGHEELRDVLGCHSMSQAPTAALQQLMHAWTGHNLRQPTKLPRRGYVKSGELEMVSGADLNTLAAAFSLRGWDQDTRRNFIRRQLRGRETITTRSDFYRVFSGVRAMNRRDDI